MKTKIILKLKPQIIHFFVWLLLVPLGISQSAFANWQMKALVVPHKLSSEGFYEKYTAIGECKFANSKDYFARVNGKVEFVSGTQGDKVSKGQIVIAIDKEIAEKLKSQAEADLYLAESNYSRDLLLLKKKVISEEGLNQSKAALEKAKNDHAKALNTYNDMVIKAVDDGYIGVVKADVSDEVQVGDYLFSLTTNSIFYIFVELPETMRKKVLTSDEVQVRTKEGKVIPGKILAVSDYLSNNGTITAKLEFPYTEELLHGSFVEVEVTFNKHKALALPEKAVLKNNQGNFVYAITSENKVKQVFVTLGVRTNSVIELLSNELKEGDSIVIDGLTKIYDGAEVEIKEEKQP